MKRSFLSLTSGSNGLRLVAPSLPDVVPAWKQRHPPPREVKVGDVMMHMPSIDIGFVYILVTRVEKKGKEGAANPSYFFQGHVVKHTGYASRGPPPPSSPVSKFYPASAWTFMPDMTYNLHHYRKIAANHGRIDNVFEYVLANAVDDADTQKLLQTILQICDSDGDGARLRSDQPFEWIISRSFDREQICQCDDPTWWYATRIHISVAHFNLALRWHSWRKGVDKTVFADWKDIRVYALALFDGVEQSEKRFRAEDEADDAVYKRAMDEVVSTLAKAVAEEAIEEETSDDGDIITAAQLFGEDDDYDEPF
jgi:hypothetical protein